MTETDAKNLNEERKPLEGARLAFIGCGVMAEAIISGLLRNNLVSAEQIVGSNVRAGLAQASGGTPQHGYFARRDFGRSNLSNGKRQPAHCAFKSRVGGVSKGRSFRWETQG
jgi:hypothetical protein